MPRFVTFFEFALLRFSCLTGFGVRTILCFFPVHTPFFYMLKARFEVWILQAFRPVVYTFVKSVNNKFHPGRSWIISLYMLVIVHYNTIFAIGS